MEKNAYKKILNALDVFLLNAMVTALKNGWNFSGTDLQKQDTSDEDLKNVRNSVKNNILFIDELIQEDLYSELHVDVIEGTEKITNSTDNLLHKLNSYYSVLLQIIQSSGVIKDPKISAEEFVHIFGEDGKKVTLTKDLKNLPLIIESAKAVHKMRVAIHNFKFSRNN